MEFLFQITTIISVVVCGISAWMYWEDRNDEAARIVNSISVWVSGFFFVLSGFMWWVVS